MASDPRPHRAILLGLIALGSLPLLLNGFYNPLLAQSQLAVWAADLFATLLLPLLIVWTVVRRGLATLDELGFHRRIRGRARPILLAALLVVIPTGGFVLDWFWVRLLDELVPAVEPYGSFSYVRMVWDLPPGWARLAGWVYIAVSAGLWEETMCRGLLARLFPSGPRGLLAYLASSTLLFAALHWEGGAHQLIRAAGFGLLAALLYRTIGNLWPVALWHTLVDLFWLLQ